MKTNLVLDWSGASEPRSDITRQQWEDGVTATVHELFDKPPYGTSRALLLEIFNTPKKIKIVPERQPLLPNKGDANAHADPVNPPAATLKGGTASDGSVGIGGGSEVILTFTAQDWEASTKAASLRARDETLLHELVHALRQAKGIEDSFPLEAPFSVLRQGGGSVSQLMAGMAGKQGPYSQIYNEYEEFVAILLTNIYRSETGRQGLRRDHLGGNALLLYPLTNPRNFLTVWRPQIARVAGEMRALCEKVAGVSCDFNPIFELYAAEGRFGPGGRAVR